MRVIKRVFFVLILFCGLTAGCTNFSKVTETITPTDTQQSPTVQPTATTEIRYFEKAIDTTVPVIFSHDGAPDDITTLVFLSKHPNVNLLGVIQSYGEQHPEKSLANWQIFLYDVLDLDQVPIGLGSEKPLDSANNEFPSSWRTSADNFWGVPLPKASQDYVYENGADLIVRLVKESPEKVVILATGAQTDVALALQQNPEISDNISQIVIMGGSFNRDGNLNESPGYENNHVAEWNIFVDPLAAKQVFNSGVPLSIISLDGSDDFVITREDYSKITNSGDPALDLLANLWDQNFKLWGGDFKIWDIVSGVAVTNPGYFIWTYDGVDVIVEAGETLGQTIRLNNKSKKSRFSASTDFGKVHQTVFDILNNSENK